MNMTKRMGFACKIIDNPAQVDGIAATDACKMYNTGGTTITWLNRQSRGAAEQKLWDLMVQNTASVKAALSRVAKDPLELRMFRISSDVLGAYTHANWSYFWQQPEVIAECERRFGEIGNLAREHDIRLSFHPGQFTVLASNNPGIVENSIKEFEYHADMAKFMGYGKKFQDLKINVHISGSLGPDGIRAAYQRLSPEARNCITIENEENSWGLDDCLSISDIIPIVLDVHHYWIREGVYISPDSDSVKRVVDSWRGIRPVMHYSVSREDYLVEHDSSVSPDYKALLESGHKKQKLRAHSDFYWNNSVNEWALSFWDKFDIMCESKAKNLARNALYEFYQKGCKGLAASA